MKKILFSTIAMAAVILVCAQTVRKLEVVEKNGKINSFDADQVQAVVFQEAPRYVQLTDLINTAYEEKGNSGLYAIELGTSAPDMAGYPAQVGDMQISMLLMAPKSADLSKPVLPAGFYTIGNSSADYTFDVAKSILWIRTAEGAEGVSPQMIVAGTVDVRESEGNYDIRCEFTTMGGAVDMRYVGPLPINEGVSDFSSFTEPLDLTFTSASGRFYGNWYYPFAADLTAEFFQGTVTDGTLTDGYRLYLDLYEPKPADCMAPDQVIADGTYSVETREDFAYTYLPFRFNKGKFIDFLGEKVLTSTRVEYISEGRRKLGLIDAGTFTVSDNGTKFVFDLRTSDGISVKGTYTGKPAIRNFCDNDEKEPKRPYSSLKENVSLKWVEETVALGYDCGHAILDNANSYILMVTDPNMKNGDYISIEMLIDGSTVADGTYSVSRTLAAGNIIPGTVDFGGQPLFSWYGNLNDIDDEGYNNTMAPIESGTMSISTLTDGKRKIVFDFKDDNNHLITGEYTGAIINGNDPVNSLPVKNLKKDSSRKIRVRKVNK